MKELTLRETIDNHKVLWTWLADETLKRKRKIRKIEYFLEHGIDDIDFPSHLCYCCEYADQKSVDGSCTCCPLEWGKSNCYITSGLFRKWEFEVDYKKAAELARQIANLPLKKKFIEQYEKECRESQVIPEDYKENLMKKFTEVV